MKTIVTIELSDEERSYLADLIDGKHTKRLAKREEIKDIVKKHFANLLLGVFRDKLVPVQKLEPGKRMEMDDLLAGANAANCPHCQTTNTFNAEGRDRVQLACHHCGSDFLAVTHGGK